MAKKANRDAKARALLGLAGLLAEQARECIMSEGDFYPQQVGAMRRAERLLVKLERFARMTDKRPGYALDEASAKPSRP